MMKSIFLTLSLVLIFFTYFFGKNQQQPSGHRDSMAIDIIIKGLAGFYQEHSFIQHDLVYKLFPDSASSIPHSTEHGVFIKKGNKQYSRLSSIESLSAESYSIAIDHEEKAMLISKPIHVEATAAVPILNELKREGSTVTHIELSEELHEILVEMEFGEIKTTRILYHPGSYQVNKLVFLYRRSIHLSTTENDEPVTPRLEVHYLSTSFHETDPDLLNMNTYVTGGDIHWRPAARYHDFEIINNIPNE